MKRKHTRLWRIWVGILAAWLIGGAVSAREWSDEIQMTNAGRMYLNGSFFGAVVDSNDVLHISYSVNNANLEGQPGEQAVYQQFNKFGEPLTDPIFIGSVFPVEESIERGINCYDIFLDKDQNIHLLWGQDTICHTMFDIEGNYITSGRLEGIMSVSLRDMGVPHGVIDSEGRIVIVSRSCTPWDPEAQRRDNFLSYGRWTFEGELLDTLHFLAEGPAGSVAMDPQIYITEGDTLHFRWNQHPVQEAWFYAKVGPNDERILGPLELFEPTEDEYRLGLWNFLVDDQYRITHRVYRRFNHRRDLVANLTQYLPNLNIRFDREIDGEGYGGVWGHVRFGHNQDIHIASIRVYDPEMGASGCGIAYSRFSIDGEYIDSLQIPQRSILTNQMWPAVFSDSTVAIIWSDDRFADGFRSKEIFMRYSLVPNQIIKGFKRVPYKISLSISAHPNPFNDTVMLNLKLPEPGKYKIRVQNITGEEVWSTELAVNDPISKSLFWEAKDRKGLPLPSGSYVCILEGVTNYDSVILNLVR